MNEQKIYLIGGKKFELRPLSLRQRQLAAPVSRKIISALQKLLEVGSKGVINLSDAFAVSVDLDAIILAEDLSFAKFLATILTPAGDQWSVECVTVNEQVMLEIDETTQAEVLQNFLTRQTGLTSGSPSFMQIVSNEKSKSLESGDSRE